MSRFAQRQVQFGLAALFLISFSVAASAQSDSVVRWTFSAKKKAANTYDVVLTAELARPWHIYSQNAGDGPVSTTITFKANPLIKPLGRAIEVGKLIKAYESAFKSETRYYFDKVQFISTVKVKGTAAARVSGEVEFMVVSDTKALPPSRKPFSVDLQ